VAGEPAELRGIHVLDAPVGRPAQDHHVEQGGGGHQANGAAQHRTVEVDARVIAGQRFLRAQSAAAPDEAGGDEEQAGHEHGRQHQEEHDARVGVDGRTVQHLERPEAHHGERGARGQHRAGQRQRVGAQVDDRPRPPYQRTA
jgi:hypothetical protein